MSEQEKMHSQISMVRRLANFINVTAAELRATNEKLQEMADTDELTGLYNRRMLTRLLHDALIRANKYNLDMVVGIVDIDHFKQVNDTFGHAAGDQVLKTLGKEMYREVEKLPSGVFGRWGGEEFLFIAPTLNIETIFKNIDLARERVSAIPIEGVGNITISLGCTGFKQGDTLESIFSRADAALYEAKETGRNKSCIK
jgi:diguanylate cyclase (GGDEF)-like protein